MANFLRPEFRKALYGYNPKHVDDYVSRLEAELEILEVQQQKTLQKLESCKREHSNLQVQVKNLDAQLEEKNQVLEEIQSRLQAPQSVPQAIQDSIICAQRMGSIIVREAAEQANKLRSDAELEYTLALEKIQQEVDQTRQHTAEMISLAQQRCEDLQTNYDRILMEVSGFKQEMIGLYRKHLELLYALPDCNSSPAPGSVLELDAVSEMDDSEA